jgi:hypothetical protein
LAPNRRRSRDFPTRSKISMLAFSPKLGSLVCLVAFLASADGFLSVLPSIAALPDCRQRFSSVAAARAERRAAVGFLLFWTVETGLLGGSVAPATAGAIPKLDETAIERAAQAAAALKQQEQAEAEALKNSQLGQLLLKRTEKNKEKNSAAVRAGVCRQQVTIPPLKSARTKCIWLAERIGTEQCPGKPLGRDPVTEFENYCEDCRSAPARWPC